MKKIFAAACAGFVGAVIAAGCSGEGRRDREEVTARLSFAMPDASSSPTGYWTGDFELVASGATEVVLPRAAHAREELARLESQPGARVLRVDLSIEDEVETFSLPLSSPELAADLKQVATAFSGRGRKSTTTTSSEPEVKPADSTGRCDYCCGGASAWCRGSGSQYCLWCCVDACADGDQPYDQEP